MLPSAFLRLTKVSLLCHRTEVFWPKAACVSITPVWASPLALWSRWTLSEALPLARGVCVQSHTPSLHGLSGFSSLQAPDMFKTVPRTWQDIGLMVQLNKAHLTSLRASLPNEQLVPKVPHYFYLVLMLKLIPLILWIIKQLWNFIELYLPWSL